MTDIPNVIKLAQHKFTDAHGVLSEDKVALAFAERYTDKLLYCHNSGRWHTWTGSHWAPNVTKLAFHYARELAREFSQGSNAKVSKVAFAAAVERFAIADPVFAVTADKWDRDLYLLGTPEGTVDLRTGQLRPASPRDYITKLTAVAPAETADCPVWLNFLNEVTRQDQAMIRFLQQWCGYSLTGDTREHALAFVIGPGKNGKTTFLETVSGIMNEYATTAPMETFTYSQFERHPTDLASMRGARMVTASETEEGRSWAEARIKQLTGGEKISARFMRQDFFEYVPQFKLTIIGNHRPNLRNIDDAIRRRFNLVPFEFTPPIPNKNLRNELRAEWPGILRWMINGCLDWQRNELTPAPSITEATNRHFRGTGCIRSMAHRGMRLRAHERVQDRDGNRAVPVMDCLCENCRRGARNTEGIRHAPGQEMRQGEYQERSQVSGHSPEKAAR
jgi:putative DNA primase/helicase